MRDTFAATILELAERDDRIWLLTGDLGHGVLEDFVACVPDRFVNVGVAEQNMTGVAAGLALCGKIVFTFSIPTFLLFRCLEQIRNDVCYHNANVKFVGTGGGVAYGALGYTHHAVEDLAITRALPNMTVIAPGDPVETRLATRAAVDWPGPCYLRLGKSGEPIVHKTEPEFQIGRAIVLREGTDVTLISTGTVLPEAVEAADLLQDRGISVQLLSMPTVKPLDKERVREAASTTQLVCVVEDHGEIGGLSDAIARLLATQSDGRVRFLTLKVASMLRDKVVGGLPYLHARAGLSSVGISSRVADWLEQPGGK